MREKNKYHIRDFTSIVLFYLVFTCFFVASIMGIIDLVGGNINVGEVILRLVLTLLVCVPYIIKRIFRISFSKVVSAVYYVYIFLAGFLGIVLKFYRQIEVWDILIHFLMGVCLALLSIYILNLTIYKKDTSKHNLFFTFIFMILFALGIGAIWEIFEFILDGLLNTGFQRYVTYGGKLLVGRNAVVDTMVDIIMDFSGAIFGTVLARVIYIIDNRFLKTFKIKKLKKMEEEVENIEE